MDEAIAVIFVVGFPICVAVLGWLIFNDENDRDD